jgi:hypothetical protein
MNEGAASGENFEDRVAKRFDSRTAMTDVLPVLEARRRDVMTGLFAGTIGRTMPWKRALFAPGHEFFTLLGIQFTPEIHGFTHEFAGRHCKNPGFVSTL